MDDVSLRGFVYAMQPVMQRKQWQTERSLRELAQAQGRVQQAAQAHEEQSAAYLSHAGQAREAWRARPDPASYQRLLSFLVDQHSAKLRLEAQLEELRLARKQSQARCVALQCALEGLRRHRKDCEVDYAAGERTRLLAQADDDWVMRHATPAAGATR